MRRYPARAILAAIALICFQSMGLAHAAKFEFQDHQHHGMPCTIMVAVENGSHLDLAADQVIPVCNGAFEAPQAQIAKALTRPPLLLPTTRAPPAR
ncbi:MAG: hypothetical protein EP340_11300 [Alphaproteobacteria bacterium]|nr:MAG: hypothetical protein EP340_11300 [Alphaproteobacteria bacterium]